MPRYIQTRRLVLHGCPARQQAEQFAQSRGWRLLSESFDTTAGASIELIWGIGPRIAFYYVENAVSDDCCVGLAGEDRDAAARLLPSLVESFDVWTVEGLLDAIDGAEGPVASARAIMRAGLGAPVEYDERFFSRLRDAAEHSEPMVREIALCAMVYPGWPQFRPILRRAAEFDPVERVAERATYILEGFDRAGVPEQ